MTESVTCQGRYKNKETGKATTVHNARVQNASHTSHLRVTAETAKCSCGGPDGMAVLWTAPVPRARRVESRAATKGSKTATRSAERFLYGPANEVGS